MKPAILLAVLSLALFFSSCKKESFLENKLANSNAYLDSSLTYIRANLSANDFDKLDLSSSRTLTYRDQNWGIQIFKKASNSNTFLLLEKKNSNCKGNWVDMSSLTKISSRYASGSITLSSLDKSSITKLIVDSNEVIRTESKVNNNLANAVDYSKKNQPGNVINNNSSPDVASPVLPAVVIYYDVNAASAGDGTDYVSWYWLIDQLSDDSYAYIQSSEGGGGSSAGKTSNVANAPVSLSPDQPIEDLKEELKCFTSNSTSICSISININEPDPGTRDLVNPLSSFPVGHTFLTLEQDNPDGTSIIRSVGFYPRDFVNPGTLTDQSIFGDDSNTPFNISMRFTVAAGQLMKVASTLVDQQALQYDLDNFNCTNSAVYALKSISINLPDTKSMESLFDGNDPGDLGEDLRALNLNNFSVQNGNVPITRTISNSDNQLPKPRTGACQ